MRNLSVYLPATATAVMMIALCDIYLGIFLQQQQQS
jgi:hypothetical protein